MFAARNSLAPSFIARRLLPGGGFDVSELQLFGADNAVLSVMPLANAAL